MQTCHFDRSAPLSCRVVKIATLLGRGRRSGPDVNTTRGQVVRMYGARTWTRRPFRGFWPGPKPRPVRTKKPGIPICSICSTKKRTFYFIRYLIIYSPFFPYFPYFFTLFLQYFHFHGTNGTNGTNTEKPCFYWCFRGFNLFRTGGPFWNKWNKWPVFVPFQSYLFPICSLFVPRGWNKLRA